MTDDELLRYSRHLLLDEIGIEGQARIAAAHVLVIGVGGLGAAAALYLGGAGLRSLTLVDADTVEASNLQRQIIHTQADVGRAKVESARAALEARHPGGAIAVHARRADQVTLAEWVDGAGVVLDCSDNFATRQAVNAACTAAGVPLVAGAAVGFEGQLSTFDTRDPAAPCYACLFPPDAAIEEMRCATTGVFAPLVGIIGSLQAAEALKLVTGVGTSLAGRLSRFDARRMAWSEIRVRRVPDCPVCAHRPHHEAAALG